MTGFPGVCYAHFCGGSAGRSVTVVIPVGREVRRLGIHRRGLAGLGICRPRRQCASLPRQHVEAGDQVHLRVPPPEVCLLPQQDACRGHTTTGRGSPLLLFRSGYRPATLRGCVAALHAVWLLDWLPPLRWERLWRLAKSPVAAPGDRPYAGPHVLQVMAEACRSPEDWGVLAAAVMSFSSLARVSEIATSKGLP